jgi:Ca2+-binding EF-hand superfamily protein
MIKSMIGSADINSDGNVSEEEFTEMLMRILKT